MKIVISSAARTPIGSLQGALGSVKAGHLGAAAITGAVDRAGVEPAAVDALFMGNVLQAGQGQAPARQAAIYAGLDASTPSVTINKMCGSGMEAIIQAARAVALGDATVAVAGGMESMTNAPYLLPGARAGLRLGNATVVDSLVHDGLWDVYNDKHMGSCAELCATRYSLTRDEQDEFAITSYRRAQRAQADGTFAAEIVPVDVTGRRGSVTRVELDEGPTQVDFEKLRTLRPVFEKDGTVTAANASTINDGAAALVITSEAAAAERGLTVLATIEGYAAHGEAPEWFTTAPVGALRSLLTKTGWTPEELDSKVGTRVTTRGGKGVVIVESGAEPIEVGIVPSDNLLDPTGVGDAFRAGFLSGVTDGYSLERSAQFGALIATHVLETTGTQEWTIDPVSARRRLVDAYGADAAEELAALLPG